MFNDKGLDKKYSLYNFLDGLYWNEDFNGDGKIDIAILIAEISTKKKGILIIDGKTGNYFVFGAGIKFWKEHDDFSGAKRWGVSSQKDADEQIIDPKTGKPTGTRVVKFDQRNMIIVDDWRDDTAVSVQGLIYWKNNKYLYLFQGF